MIWMMQLFSFYALNNIYSNTLLLEFEHSRIKEMIYQWVSSPYFQFMLCIGILKYITLKSFFSYD